MIASLGLKSLNKLYFFGNTIIAFFTLLFFVRLMGKQQISQLTFFDYVVGITIGSIGSTISVQVNENTTATLIGMATWTSLAILLAYLGVENVWIQKGICMWI